jgi:hypothetical protein
MLDALQLSSFIILNLFEQIAKSGTRHLVEQNLRQAASKIVTILLLSKSASLTDARNSPNNFGC